MPECSLASFILNKDRNKIVAPGNPVTKISGLRINPGMRKFVLLKNECLMTTIQAYLSGLPEETKQRFTPVFGNLETFYDVVYLVIKNEHIADTEKPERYEERLHAIRIVKQKIEELLTSWGLNGNDVVADIASDYFEDYVQYKEPEFHLTNEQFIDIVRKVMQAG